MARAVQLSFYRFALRLADSPAVRMLHQVAREVYADLGGLDIEQAIADYKTITARWRSGGEGVGVREFLRAQGCVDRGNARRDTLRERAWVQARAEVFQATGERIPLPQSPEDMDRRQTAEEAEIVKGLSAQIRAIGAMSDELVANKVFAGVPEGSGPSTGSGPEPVDSGRGSGTISRIPPREMEPDPAAQAGSSGSGTFLGKQPPKKEPDPMPEKEPDSAPVFQYATGPQDEPPTNKQIKHGVNRLIAARVKRELVFKLRDLARAGHYTRAKWNSSLHKLLTA